MGFSKYSPDTQYPPLPPELLLPLISPPKQHAKPAPVKHTVRMLAEFIPKTPKKDDSHS